MVSLTVSGPRTTAQNLFYGGPVRSDVIPLCRHKEPKNNLILLIKYLQRESSGGIQSYNECLGCIILF